MAELKTKKNDASVEVFLRRVADPKRRDDCFTVLELMREVTRLEPKMWGKSIVGFGTCQYKYASGRGGEWFVTGFSPRKTTLTLYLMSGFPRHGELMKNLGKYKTGVACLYVKQLDDIDLPTLRELMKESFEHVCKNYNAKPDG